MPTDAELTERLRIFWFHADQKSAAEHISFGYDGQNLYAVYVGAGADVSDGASGSGDIGQHFSIGVEGLWHGSLSGEDQRAVMALQRFGCSP